MTVIKAENISKAYQLGQFSTGTLSRDIERWWAIKRGKEDPFLKIGETNDRTKKGKSDIVWSLKDINFEIQQGDAVGIIGRNGAGKSTLLKILSQITSPTTGTIKMKGRIASLLEVGTGFHPELSGRENIFLNGAILGMRKKEITRKFDEIVDFSGVERYIDTPVKRYSSGMYVRLAFAVAAHLESEILIVDEVLAVGDAEFQKKCLGKMGDISKGQGRTVLFVSHNMAAVRSLCTTGLFLKNGTIHSVGSISDITQKYSSLTQDKILKNVFHKRVFQNKEVELTYAETFDDTGNSTGLFQIGECIIVKCRLIVKKIIPNLYGYLTVQNVQGDSFIESDTNDNSPNILENLKIGENNIQFKISKHILSHGKYILYMSFASMYSDNFHIDVPGDILTFEIIDSITGRGLNRKSYTSYFPKWFIENDNK